MYRQSHRLALQLLLFLFIATIPAAGPSMAGGQVHAQPVDSMRQSGCREFVQNFYTWYQRAAEHSGYEVAIDKRPGQFGSELLRALRTDNAAQKRSPGEIVGLDFDPFLNSQDVADRYDAKRVSRRGNRFFVDVFARQGSEKILHAAVTPELRIEHGKWVFVNFHYGGDASRSGPNDLLSVLRKLRSERAKH